MFSYRFSGSPDYSEVSPCRPSRSYHAVAKQDLDTGVRSGHRHAYIPRSPAIAFVGCIIEREMMDNSLGGCSCSPMLCVSTRQRFPVHPGLSTPLRPSSGGEMCASFVHQQNPVTAHEGGHHSPSTTSLCCELEHLPWTENDTTTCVLESSWQVIFGALQWNFSF
jgi:hypothetical protein